MRNGHNLEPYVIPILKKLNYLEKNIIKITETLSKGNYPIPDYLINTKLGQIAVEVGSLSKKEKISHLLEKYQAVIWIFIDSELPMINCITYGKKEFIENKNALIIKKEANKTIQELTLKIKNIEDEKKSDKREIKHLREKLDIIQKFSNEDYKETNYNFDKNFNKHFEINIQSSKEENIIDTLKKIEENKNNNNVKEFLNKF